ncbi:hypothetical protein N7454_009365 [Penicillium verhagenii]|nr:hypothetical protein N7454_009365 [Penicillium verhagenii]
MLLKNILASGLAIASMTTALPTDGDYELSLDKRTGQPPQCKPQNSWCCQYVAPLSILWFGGFGSGCQQAKWGQQCKPGSSPLCCQGSQLVDVGYILQLPPWAQCIRTPFYNRPPTPLPPSPSLTSLLRPPFSTTTSRPTTPDSSDVETPNDTEAAVAKSARRATTVPRASPKVPTYEYYGFVLYLASSLAFLFYLLWSYLPSPFLHQLGIYYYPNRWWSLAIPSWLVMSIVYIYIALASYNTGYLTLPMNSIENIVDEVANVAVIDGKARRRPGGATKMKPGATSFQIMGPQNRKVNWWEIWNEGTDAVMDIPVGGVCEVLYGHDRDEDGFDS